MLEQVVVQVGTQVGTQDPSAEAMAVAQTAPSATPRLIVIDDDNLHRMIICRVAAKAGYAPAGAATYDEAAKLLQENSFDCMTLDLSLGQHAGVELLRHAWVLGRKMPIIIISGSDDSSWREAIKVAESLKLNVWQAIPKPVDLGVLRHWLERLKAERETPAVSAA
jgi:two-component system, chemotaxis family, chemotaxis protein CheY